VKPPFWWSEIKARRACRESLGNFRHVSFLAALDTARKHELEWLLISLGINHFSPSRYTNESDADFCFRVRSWMKFHEGRLLRMLKTSWDQRRKIKKLTNSLAKALRRR
jgi:hypothetical protein